MKRSIAMSLVVAVLFAAAAVLVTAVSATGAQAAPTCNCPDVFAPVICSNGRAYDNYCYARCDHAKQCVPLEP